MTTLPRPSLVLLDEVHEDMPTATGAEQMAEMARRAGLDPDVFASFLAHPSTLTHDRKDPS